MDFGSDVGNTGVQIAGNVAMKIFEALQALFAKVFELYMNRDVREKARLENKEMKSVADKREFLEKVDESVGLVRYQDAVKAGIPLTNAQLQVTDKEFKRLAEICKRNGVFLTGTMDARQNELGVVGVKKFNIMCKTSQLEDMINMVKILNDERIINNLADRKGEILRQGADNLTPQDLADINELDRKIQEIKTGHCHELNDAQAGRVCDRVVNGGEEPSVEYDFNSVMNKKTGGQLDKDSYSYIVDAADPTKHIVCHGYNAEYNGAGYIKTDYQVYNADALVFETHDGRFDGRPLGYWDAQKAQMKEIGGFSDTVLKFQDSSEYQHYLDKYMIENDKELSFLQFGKENRDYGAILNALDSELAAMKLSDSDMKIKPKYENGVVIDGISGKPISELDASNLSLHDRTVLAECVVIGKMMDNYTALSQYDTEFLLANANLSGQTPDTPGYAEAINNLTDVNARYRAAVDGEYSLICDRREINAVQVEQRTRGERVPLDDEKIRKDDTVLKACVTDIEDTKKKIADVTMRIAVDTDGANHDALRDELTKHRGVLLEQEGRYAAAISTDDDIPGDRLANEVHGDQRHTLDEYRDVIADRKTADKNAPDSAAHNPEIPGKSDKDKLDRG